MAGPRLRVRPAVAPEQRIGGALQFFLALYILLTGDLPTIIQALAIGLPGGANMEFAAAMLTSLVRDMLLLAPVLFMKDRFGILHPLLLAVIVWPLLRRMPEVIEQFGGWGGIIAGTPIETPYFVGIPSHAATTIWLAIAKYHAVEILALVSTYAGFWLFRPRRYRNPQEVAVPNEGAVRSVLIGLIAFSTVALLVFVYARGGIGEHLTSLGRGRFRELAGAGPVMVATDLGRIALLLWIACRPSDIKSPLFLSSLAVVIAGQFISNGSRSAALTVPLLVGLVWAMRRRQVPWKLGLVLLPLFFAAIGLLGAVRSASWTGDTAGEAIESTSFTQSLVIAQQEVAQRRAVSAQVPIVARGFDVTDGPMLGRSYLAAIFAAVPRSIWPNKPRGPDSLYAQLFLGQPAEGTAIPVSPEAEMFWNFGFPGVLVLSALYGMLLRSLSSMLARRYWDPFAIVFCVIIVTSFQFATKPLVVMQQQLPLLLLCYMAVSALVPKRRSKDSAFRNPLTPQQRPQPGLAGPAASL